MISQIRHRKKKLGSYPYLLVLLSLIFSLTIIGFWGSILLMGHELQIAIKENITVQVYLQKELSEDSITTIIKEVSSKPFILNKSGKPQIEFVSKEISAKKFIQETGENFADFLGDNPLRDALIIKIDPNFSQGHQLKAIKDDLSKLDGIFEVVYTETLADEIHKNIEKLALAAGVFTAIVLIVIFLLVNNTIKLAMYSQRFLIRSMQLVGARPWFIQKPYLSRSFWLGILGGTIASICILVLLEYARKFFPEISNLLFLKRELQFLGTIIVAGGLLCFISSLLAVNRYLGKSLDDLY